MFKRSNKVEVAQSYQARQLGYANVFRNTSINELFDASVIDAQLKNLREPAPVLEYLGSAACRIPIKATARASQHTHGHLCPSHL